MGKEGSAEGFRRNRLGSVILYMGLAGRGMVLGHSAQSTEVGSKSERTDAHLVTSLGVLQTFKGRELLLLSRYAPRPETWQRQTMTSRARLTVHRH